MNVDFEGKTISREEVEKQVKQDIANQLGVDSFDELSQSKLEQDMLDKGLDPDIALPILKELLKKDPEYQAAMKYKDEYDKLVQDSARAADIAALNAKFGTKFEKYEDIPENVRQLADKGVSLEKRISLKPQIIIPRIAPHIRRHCARRYRISYLPRVQVPPDQPQSILILSRFGNLSD